MRKSIEELFPVALTAASNNASLEIESTPRPPTKPRGPLSGVLSVVLSGTWNCRIGTGDARSTKPTSIPIQRCKPKTRVPQEEEDDKYLDESDTQVVELTSDMEDEEQEDDEL